MAEKDDLFRTALRGYDKDEVEQEFQKMKDASRAEKSRYQKELNERKRLILRQQAKMKELQKEVEEKTRALAEKEREIKEKYQSYIDNYDTIGSLLYDSKVRAKQTAREAEEQKEKILKEANDEAAKIRDAARAEAEKVQSDAQAEADRILEDVRTKAEQELQDSTREVDRKTQESHQKYEAVQEELNNVVGLLNRVQRLFMQSYKSIQTMVSTEGEDGSDCASGEEKTGGEDGAAE